MRFALLTLLFTVLLIPIVAFLRSQTNFTTHAAGNGLNVVVACDPTSSQWSITSNWDPNVVAGGANYTGWKLTIRGPQEHTHDNYLQTSHTDGPFPSNTTITITVQGMGKDNVVSNTVKTGEVCTEADSKPVSVSDVSVIKQEIGVGGTENTQNFGVCGADLGSMFEWLGKVYVVFGDTFGCPMSSQPGQWRNNTLAISNDGGKTLNNWIKDSSGKAKELIHRDNGAVTNIPTYGVGVSNAAYLYYMQVTNWDPWTCDYSSIAKSADGGNNWQKLSNLKWQGNGNFNQVGIYKKDGYIYLFGVPCGRGGPIKLMRVRESAIENKANYEYLTGLSGSFEPVWSVNSESAAIAVVNDESGELSVSYNNTLGRYMLMYTKEGAGLLLRTSSRLWGPWSQPVTIANNDYPCLYAPYTMDRWNQGTTVYFRMSRFCPGFNPYTTYWMRMSVKNENIVSPSATVSPTVRPTRTPIPSVRPSVRPSAIASPTTPSNGEWNYCFAGYPQTADYCWSGTPEQGCIIHPTVPGCSSSTGRTWPGTGNQLWCDQYDNNHCFWDGNDGQDLLCRYYPETPGCVTPAPSQPVPPSSATPTSPPNSTVRPSVAPTVVPSNTPREYTCTGTASFTATVVPGIGIRLNWPTPLTGEHYLFRYVKQNEDGSWPNELAYRDVGIFNAPTTSYFHSEVIPNKTYAYHLAVAKPGSTGTQCGPLTVTAQ